MYYISPAVESEPTLEELETRIRKICVSRTRAILDIGEGLRRIRDEKLYLDHGFSTFKYYLEDGLRISEAFAYRYMSITEVFLDWMVQEFGFKLMPALSWYRRATHIQRGDFIDWIQMEGSALTSTKVARYVAHSRLLRWIGRTEGLVPLKPTLEIVAAGSGGLLVKLEDKHRLKKLLDKRFQAQCTDSIHESTYFDATTSDAIAKQSAKTPPPPAARLSNALFRLRSALSGHLLPRHGVEIERRLDALRHPPWWDVLYNPCEVAP